MRGHSYKVIPISWRNRKEGESKLSLQEMGSRYAFIVLYVLLERHLSRGDYRRPGAERGRSGQKRRRRRRARRGDDAREVGRRRLRGRRARCSRVAYLAPVTVGKASEMDEGAVVAYAARVLDGAVPHRDFLTFYGPGNLWFVAGAFAVVRRERRRRARRRASCTGSSSSSSLFLIGIAAGRRGRGSRSPASSRR